MYKPLTLAAAAAGNPIKYDDTARMALLVHDSLAVDNGGFDVPVTVDAIAMLRRRALVPIVMYGACSVAWLLT